MRSAVNFALIHMAISVRMVWCCGPVASEKPNTTRQMDGNSLHSSSALAEYVATGNTSVTSHPDEQRWSRNENGLKDDVPLTKDYRDQNRKQEAKKNYPRKEDKHRPLKPSAVVSAIIKNASFHYSQISAAPSAGTQSTPMELDTYGYESNERLDTATAQIANLVPSPSLNASAVSEPTVLSRVQLNANVTATSSTEEPSPCELWERCPINHDARVSQWLRDLPSCPCVCPKQLFLNSSLYDPHLNKYFHWRVVGSTVDNEAIVRWTAAFCILQQLSRSSTSIAVQVCCYDSARKLVTRGVGAGTPYLASPDVSDDLHEKLDILPLFACLGDWTRYHVLRPPNNGHKCPENPNEEEYALQVKNAQDF